MAIGGNGDSVFVLWFIVQSISSPQHVNKRGKEGIITGARIVVATGKKLLRSSSSPHK